MAITLNEALSKIGTTGYTSVNGLERRALKPLVMMNNITKKP